MPPLGPEGKCLCGCDRQDVFTFNVTPLAEFSKSNFNNIQVLPGSTKNEPNAQIRLNFTISITLAIFSNPVSLVEPDSLTSDSLELGAPPRFCI